MTTVIAVDPGKLSGYAVLSYDPDVDVRAQSVLVTSMELDAPNLWAQLEADLMMARMTDLRVVFEEFKITTQTGKNTDAPWSLENIGVIKYLSNKYGVTWLAQPPARAKNFVTNERLRKLKLWHKGGAGHANDALRHGVLYLVEQLDWRSPDLLL